MIILRQLFILSGLLGVLTLSAQTEQWTKDIKNDWRSRVGVSYINSLGEIYLIGGQIGHYSYDSLGRTFVDKYDDDGNLLWHKYGFSGTDVNNIASDDGENIYFAGYFHNYGGNTPLVNDLIVQAGTYVVKISPDGQVLWVSDNLGKCFPRALFVSADGKADLRSENDDPGGRIHHLDADGHLVETNYHPIVLAGQYDRYGNAYQQYDADIVKYDPSENILWKHPIHNGFTNFVVDPEGNVYVREGGFAPGTTLYKLDPNGKTVWVNNFSGDEEYFLPYVTGKNLYTINRFGVNLQYQGFIIRRLDANTGTSLWSWTYTDSRMSPDIMIARDGAAYVAFSHMEAVKCKLTKLTDDAWISEIPTAISKTNFAQGLSVKPNPTMDKVLIQSPDLSISTILVRDALGKQISSRKLERSLDGMVEVDFSTCPQGLYFIDVVLENNTRQACKIIRQ